MDIKHWCLFVSAGDNTEFYKMWTGKEKMYDMWVCYYGSRTDEPYRPYADIYVERKGSKFQNFYYYWTTDERLRGYKYYFIVDDDIIIYVPAINNLFRIMSQLPNIKILQPAFSKKGKISHPLTAVQPRVFMRYVNFVENTAMMMPVSAVTRCMEVYDSSLAGFGIDWLFIWHLGKDAKDSYAIVDGIPCINPHRSEREIDKLQKHSERVKMWIALKNRLNIKTWKHVTFKALVR
jgi:hypothetical protein